MTAEETVIMLDDWSLVQSVDKRNMLRMIDELPEQFETALAMAREFAIEPSVEPLSTLCVTAVAESATIAELAVTSMNDCGTIPTVFIGSRPIPNFVGENTAVVVIDYHGKSETILRNYRAATARGARIFVATSGGPLLQAAVADGARIFRMAPGQPARTAVGYLFVPVVCIAQSLGLVTGGVERIASAVLRMKAAREEFRFARPLSSNPAKQIADLLSDKTIAVYGSGGYGDALAKRWSSQIAANAKRPSMNGFFPDAAYGDLSTWENHDGIAPGFVFLTDPEDTVDSRSLMQIAEKLAPAQVSKVAIKGGSSIEKALYGLMLGDYVSCYLALLAQTNPTPMEIVQSIESRLGRPETEPTQQGTEA